MSKRIVIVSDTQIPYEDRRAVRAVLRFIGDYQPDQVIHIGDLMDFPQPSRWNKDTRGEFEGSVFTDAEKAKLRFLAPLRTIYVARSVSTKATTMSGHGRTSRSTRRPWPRARLSTWRRCSTSTGSGSTCCPSSTRLHRVGSPPRAPWSDQLSRIAGNTALNAARKFDTSVIMGHTHRQGILSHTSGYGGISKKIVTGVEVGNLMDMRQADYLKGGTGNWQSGFGLLTIEGRHVKPEIIPITNGRFTVDGHTWEV